MAATLNIPQVETNEKNPSVIFLNYNGARVRAERSYLVRPGRKTRVYGNADDAKVEALVGFPYSDLKHTTKGEDPEMDKLWKRWNRATVILMRETAEKALKVANIDHEEKLSFSRKAGCSMCPCSPGFVAKEQFMVEIPDKGAFIMTDVFPN